MPVFLGCMDIAHVWLVLHLHHGNMVHMVSRLTVMQNVWLSGVVKVSECPTYLACSENNMQRALVSVCQHNHYSPVAHIQV